MGNRHTVTMKRILNWVCELGCRVLEWDRRLAHKCLVRRLSKRYSKLVFVPSSRKIAGADVHCWRLYGKQAGENTPYLLLHQAVGAHRETEIWEKYGATMTVDSPYPSLDSASEA
jgi:hypothetical protein